jgi:hypothetical protein
MAEADDDNITPPARLPWSTPVVTHTPQAWSVEAHLQGGRGSGLRVDAERHHDLNLDRPPPLAAEKWLDAAAKRMNARPDRPDQITQAARQLESEMHEAFIRRQCDEQWGWGDIKNKLLRWGLWRRRRSPPAAKRSQAELPQRHYIPEWKRDNDAS